MKMHSFPWTSAIVLASFTENIFFSLHLYQNITTRVCVNPFLDIPFYTQSIKLFIFQCLSLDLGSWLFYINSSTLSSFKFAFSILHHSVIYMYRYIYFKIYIILTMHNYVSLRWVCACGCGALGTHRQHWIPCRGVIGNWKAVDMGTKHWAYLCKNTTYSHSLRDLLALHLGLV